MAEERICINFIPDEPCNGCEVEHECPFDCPTKKEYDRCMPRKEAIEKMAKAICKRAMFGCERCVFGKDKENCEEWIAFNHIMDAEAALNALLGGKDA